MKLRKKTMIVTAVAIMGTAIATQFVVNATPSRFGGGVLSPGRSFDCRLIASGEPGAKYAGCQLLDALFADNNKTIVIERSGYLDGDVSKDGTSIAWNGIQPSYSITGVPLSFYRGNHFASSIIKPSSGTGEIVHVTVISRVDLTVPSRGK